MELRTSYLRYLLAVYELGQTKPAVGTVDIAKALDCSKASVSRMVSTMADRDLLVRERYGKVYLTDAGFQTAKMLFRCVEEIRERLPALGIVLTDGEAKELARAVALSLPQRCREQLAAGRSASAGSGI